MRLHPLIAFPITSLLTLGVASTTSAAPAPPSFDAADARAALADIPTRPPRTSGYDRDDWPTWSDADGDGCNGREEVLLRQAEGPVQVDPVGCTIIAGDWIDPYTGELLTDPADIQIDHVVPLSEAHRSGGYRWSDEQKEAFANDLDSPELLAVAGTVNQSKGDDRPDEWLPPDAGAHCDYAIRWIEVKATYELSVVATERTTLDEILDGC
jgi:hypothetical protein